MEHVCDLAERIGDLLFDDESSDMTFIVEGEYLPAHRAIFKTSSNHFRALLQRSTMVPLQNGVVLEDVPLRGFKVLMSYVYTGQLKLEKLDQDTILEVLGLGHLWGFEKLETALSRYLKEELLHENVVAIFNKVHLLKIEELYEACRTLMIENPNVILGSETLGDLSETALCEMLSWDTFCAEEIEIFKAVLRWRVKREPEQDISNVLGELRLPLMDTKDLVTFVEDSGLIPTHLLYDAIRTKKSRAGDVNFRGRLKSDVNLASPLCGALKLTARDSGDHVTPRTCPGYDSRIMPFCSWEIDFVAATGLTVALSEPFFINHIRFRLKGKSFECSYYVEVSMNLVDWVRVIDHTKYVCDSLQNLYFDQRVARYIRLIATYTDGEGETSDWVKLKNFKVMHTTEAFELSHGFYAPRENVATVVLGASVGNGPSGSNALIEEKNEKPQWTSHEIGKGPIMIVFPQPYTVSSMRLLLRSDDSRAYLYYIETSVDKENWTRVADHTTELCSSWQNIVFEALPVLYIRIVGTASTVGKSFSCAHFECPASTRSFAEIPAQGNEVDIS